MDDITERTYQDYARRMEELDRHRQRILIRVGVVLLVMLGAVGTCVAY